MDQYGAAYAGTVSWSGSDPNVFSIDAAGGVTAVGNGQATVTALFQGLTDTASVTVAQVPAEVSPTSGADQRARAGRTLAEPVQVRVTDAGGSPVEGATVTFTPGEGHGTAEPATIASDSAGSATTVWTLGPVAGGQTLTASVAAGPSAEIGATALTPEETVAAVELLEGANQRARVGRALPQPILVRLVDADGLSVEGATVTFTPGDGHGMAEPATVASDSAGSAHTMWTLGDGIGEQVLVASVGDAVPAEIMATGLPPLTSVVVTPGRTELDFLGAVQQFTAEVRDAAGQVIQGASVTWSSSNPSVAVVNSIGLATAASNGHTTITAGIESVSGSAQLTVSQKPASVVVATGHVVAEAGKRVQNPIVATVADGGGTPIAGMSYRWTTDRQSGWVFPSEGTTDATGTIKVSWVAGWPGNGLLRLMVDTMSSPASEVNTTSTVPVSNPAGALNIRMNHQGQSAAYSIDITPLTEPPATYYAAINWDGGYAGLQRAGSRYDRQLQFSVWDVPGVGGAEVIEPGEGVICTGFGGEGTGRKCELNYPWSVGSTYRFEVTEREVNGGSAMTLHVTDIAARERRFVGTLWFARRTRMTGFTMFVEDFGHRSVHCLAQEVRSAAIRRSMALINDTWQALTQATLGRASRDSQNPGTPACANQVARSHSAGLEIVIGGENVRNPDGSLQLTVPR